MEQDRAKVLERLKAIRGDYEDYFVPIGTVDKSTDDKKSMSGLANLLAENLPITKAIVEELKDYPVYVGYDGRQPNTRSGTYTENLVLLHQAADEGVLEFIHAYCHELVHADQDRRGLLREQDVPKSPEELVPFLCHNLALEAAAYATEAVTLHYVSCYSSLLELDPTVEMLFGQYLDMPGRDLVPYYIEDSLPEDRENIEFSDYKEAWRRLFMSFFDPDSEFLDNYIVSFCSDFINRMEAAHKEDEATDADEVVKKLSDNFDLSAVFNQKPWASVAELRQITDLPGQGKVFGDESFPVLVHMIQAAVTQRRFDSVLNVVRDRAEGKMTKEVRAAKLLKQTLGQFIP